jgi:hypothetical protein
MSRGFRDNPFSKHLTKEAREHASLVEWLRWVKPGLWFHTVNEGKRTAYERFLWSIMGGTSSVPDFLFFDPKGEYNGLAIELKATGTKIFREDGKPLKDMVPQWEFLERLKKCGWSAHFASGYDEAQKLIKDYYNI